MRKVKAESMQFVMSGGGRRGEIRVERGLYNGIKRDGMNVPGWFSLRECYEFPVCSRKEPFHVSYSYTP